MAARRSGEDVDAGAGTDRPVADPGRDAASVGASTTSAVVSGIVIVIVADFLINVIAHVLHI